MYRTAIILVTIGAITFASGIFSSAAVMTAYAQPSITIQSIRCALITANQMGVGVAFVVSGVSHDSFTLKYPVAIFAPNGNLVPQAGADDIIVTIRQAPLTQQLQISVLTFRLHHQLQPQVPTN